MNYLSVRSVFAQITLVQMTISKCLQLLPFTEMKITELKELYQDRVKCTKFVVFYHLHIFLDFVIVMLTIWLTLWVPWSIQFADIGSLLNTGERNSALSSPSIWNGCRPPNMKHNSNGPSSNATFEIVTSASRNHCRQKRAGEAWYGASLETSALLGAKRGSTASKRVSHS